MTSTRFLFSSRARRRGQALILAVLVMLFAALLSSAFLVLVASNGRQIGRETDRQEASRNADDAINTVKGWLLAAPNADSWDPTTIASIAGTRPDGTPDPPPARGTVDHDFYWSPLDCAMNWDDPKQGFVKYPDPRNPKNVPQFLVSSHLIGKDEVSPGQDNFADGGDKRFMLRITIIGLSAKNPGAWSRRTLYKTTNWNGATFAYGNLVTATDANSNHIESELLGSISSSGVAAPSSISGVQLLLSRGTQTYSPEIAELGRTLMVSDGKGEPLIAVVQNRGATVNVAGPPAYSYAPVTLRVIHQTNADFSAGVKVKLVGSLFETPISLDDDGNSATPEATTAPQSVAGVRTDGTDTNTQPLGGGAYFNNGLSIPTNTTFGARPPVSSTNGNAFEGATSAYSGQNALISTGPVTLGSAFSTTPGLTIKDPSPTPQSTATASFSEQPATDNQSLRIGYTPTGVVSADTYSNSNDPEPELDRPNFLKPAPLNYPAYVAKTTAPFHILNSDDVEKFNGVPLTTSQLQRFWQRKSFVSADPATPFTTGNVSSGQTGNLAAGINAARLCYGRPGQDSYIYPMASGSLEQRGIRGWISPWEFLPRGVQIILKGTTISIVQDPLSDGSSDRPDTTKAANPAARDFSIRDITPPSNGIICTDGNARIRGTWTGTPLSIVSANNIYIEGNLKADAGKIALLAKKNVVLNPTQFVARPDGTVDTSVGRTAFTAKVQGGTLTQVSSTSSFKKGDKVAVFASGVKAAGWNIVDAIDTTANTISFDVSTPLDAAFTNGTNVKVKLACDPPIVLAQRDLGADVPTNEHFQGNVVTPADPANKDATISEVPASSLAQAGTFWAYQFKVGGDTLARLVPFGGTVGVAVSQTAQKKEVSFTVRGGRDLPNSITDDGSRHLASKTDATNPFQLLLHPHPGTATNPEQDKTFDLQALTGSPGDATSTLTELRTQLTTLAPDESGTAPKTNRWRLVLPPPVAPATVGEQDTLPARRLARVDFALPAVPDPAATTRVGDDAANVTNTPTTFRVPLTSSVLLFNSDTPLGGSSTITPLLTIGSAFDLQTGAITAADDTTTGSAPFYGQPAAWNIASGTTYAQTGTNRTFAFTRDGAGDYDDRLPIYYLSALHFQEVDPTTKASIPATSGNPKINMAVEVDATIYAEGGSWFVIPVPTPNANNAQVTNADQQIEWRRPGYAVTVNANIAQMMTPTATLDYDDEPDPDGVAVGAMQRWTDSLSYQVYNAGPPPQLLWRTIQYKALPLPALVDANTVAALPQLPASTDILYTYSN